MERIVNNIQALIFKHKNTITFISGTLILMAYASSFLLKRDDLFSMALILASILGVLPTALQAIQALKVKVISIDVLVSVAVMAAFLIQEYQESAIVTFLFLFGSFLEAKTLNTTRKAIQSLLSLAPLTALRIKDDHSFEEISIDEVELNDLCLVKTGSNIPVDGIVVSGNGVVNEASISGESMPVSKSKGDWVYAGTILDNGTLNIQTQRVGEDTTFGKIIELVEEAQDSKTTTQRFIDRFSRIYTPLVLLLSFLVWLLTQDIETSIIILVLGCPGALVIGVPVSAVAGIGNGAHHGVLFKGSEVVQTLSQVDTIVFDKTGTLTQGQPSVIEEYMYDKDKIQLQSMIASIERESNHPLAQALIKHMKDVAVLPVQSMEVIQGEGLETKVNDTTVIIGNEACMTRYHVSFTPSQQETLKHLQSQGSSIVLVAIDQQLKAMFGLQDPLSPQVKEDVIQLRRSGIKSLILLSGDHEHSVQRVAQELKLDEAHASMLPQDKSTYIQHLQNQGRTIAFVGDGINDSPSLALADIGIAMGSGTDVAIETSDVVLMRSDFKHLVHVIGLSKAMMRNMAQNILIAIGVVIFLLANVFLSEWMNMSIGMLMHELSILVVIVNGMRLLNYQKGEKS